MWFIKFIKKNQNELLKILIFLICVAGMSFLVYQKIDDMILWPYEKKTRVLLILFAFVFMEFGMYYTMKPSERFTTLLYKYLPALGVAVLISYLKMEHMLYIPFLLPVVWFCLFYDMANAFLFQAFLCLFYYFTGILTDELLILFLFYSVFVIFLVKKSDSLLKYGLSGIISVITYILISYDYQYMLVEKVEISIILKGFVPLLISLLPLYIRFILNLINKAYLKKSFVAICDDENELLLMLMDKDSKAYFHSIQVADTAVRAAKKLNANEQLVLAAARFHEIGKLKSEQYVSAGIQIMRKSHFPREVIKIVKEHNNSQAKPKTIESAIVMLADTIETSLEKIIEKKGYHIDKKRIVENIIDIRFDSGMLDDAISDVKQYKELRKAFISLY